MLAAVLDLASIVWSIPVAGATAYLLGRWFVARFETKSARGHVPPRPMPAPRSVPAETRQGPRVSCRNDSCCVGRETLRTDAAICPRRDDCGRFRQILTQSQRAPVVMWTCRTSEYECRTPVAEASTEG